MAVAGKGVGRAFQEDLQKNSFRLFGEKSTDFVSLQIPLSLLPHHLQLCQSELNFSGAEKHLAAIR